MKKFNFCLNEWFLGNVVYFLGLFINYNSGVNVSNIGVNVSNIGVNVSYGHLHAIVLWLVNNSQELTCK